MTTTELSHGVRPWPEPPEPTTGPPLPCWILLELAASTTRLRDQGEELWRAQGLTRREVLATQREVAGQSRRGVAPHPNLFWADHARPRARRFERLARAVIDEEMTRLVGTIRQGQRLHHPGPGPRLAARPGARPGPSRRLGRLPHPDELDPVGPLSGVAGDHLLTVVGARRPIDHLGRWWQRRLRWAAVRSAVRDLALSTPAEAELIVTNHAMDLLDRAPWAHGDRLLSAFELTQRELQTHARRHLAELEVVVGHRAPC